MLHQNQAEFTLLSTPIYLAQQILFICVHIGSDGGGASGCATAAAHLCRRVPLDRVHLIIPRRQRLRVVLSE